MSDVNFTEREASGGAGDIRYSGGKDGGGMGGGGMGGSGLPPERKEVDCVNSPPHYTYGGIEVIDILKAKMTPEMYEGYLMGNLLGYIFRYRLKDSPLIDLKKAEVYLGWLIKYLGDN